MADALHEQCLQAVKTAIAGLSLSGLTGGVVIQTAPNAALVALPCVIVTTEGERESFTYATNLRDDVTYPVRVWIAVRDGERETHRPTYLRWREQIARAFHHRPLAGVAEVHVCTVRPLALNADRRPEYQLLISGLAIDCTARLPRG